METAQTHSFRFFTTRRKDQWWLGPLTTGLVLGSWVIYATWAAFQGNHYEFGPYLSPFYSPLILVDWWNFSPALLILWAPGGFRLTCYYYRKAYYRAFVLDPPACAVGDARNHPYLGETSFPLIFQNAHRFFLYVALVFNMILFYDAIKAFRFEGGFGAGVGSLVLTVNAFLLCGYSFSCHCFRHLVGGGVDCFSCEKFGGAKFKAWRFASFMNERHMLWAWVSLFWVGFSDIYIRLCSMGIWTDFRFF